MIFFCKIPTNKYNYVRVLAKTFHLNGHTVIFRHHDKNLEVNRINCIKVEPKKL